MENINGSINFIPYQLLMNRNQIFLLKKKTISSNTKLVFTFRKTDHRYEATEKCLVIINLPSLLESCTVNDINKLIHYMFGKVLTKPCKMLEK